MTQRMTQAHFLELSETCNLNLLTAKCPALLSVIKHPYLEL